MQASRERGAEDFFSTPKPQNTIPSSKRTPRGSPFEFEPAPELPNESLA
jgi:hypothetical protein